MPVKLTTQDFINKALFVHKSKYNYSKVNYINSKTKIIIICKKHGKFLQTPNKHLQKSGCKKCSNEKLHKKRKMSILDFIKKSNKIHNNKYNYSKVNYINTLTKVIIICSKHGNFFQTPNAHIYKKRGCPKCNGGIKLTFNQFIKKANYIHNFKYNYSKIKYINSKTKVIIFCLRHGSFLQTPEKHIFGQGCYLCNGGSKLTTQEFINKAQKIHNNKYNYSETNYIKNSKKIIIICPKHSKFLQTPNSHLNRNGCPKCSHTISKQETKWLNNIENKQNIKIKRNLTVYIDNKRFKPDGFHKLTNTWYEYNGYFFHGHPDYYNPNDIHPIIKKTFGNLYQKTLEKESIIKSAGYNLITKWGD